MYQTTRNLTLVILTCRSFYLDNGIFLQDLVYFHNDYTRLDTSVRGELFRVSMALGYWIEDPMFNLLLLTTLDIKIQPWLARTSSKIQARELMSCSVMLDILTRQEEMGERINPTNLSDGVFKSGKLKAGKDNQVTYYTRQLVPREPFDYSDELPTIIQDNVEYRVMNTVLSNLAASICTELIHNIFVRSGSNVLYLSGDDDSSVLTISYLSDIVGKEGMVIVAGKREVVHGDNGFRILDTRSNVQCIDVDNTSYQYSAVACKNFIENTGKRIDVLFCDVGHFDQVGYERERN